MSDENKKLVSRLQKHDERAFEQVMDKYARLVAAVIYNVAKGSLKVEDVEELVTDVFVTLWQNVEKVQPESLKGYLCCIAKTRAINRLKANKFGDVLNIEDIDPEDDFNISHATEKKEISQELMELVEKIQEPDKEILIRHYFYYQKIADIANAMAIKAETVKVKLHRTRNKLKEMLMERGYTL